VRVAPPILRPGQWTSISCDDQADVGPVSEPQDCRPSTQSQAFNAINDQETLPDGLPTPRRRAADESPEGVPPTHRLGKGPDFANSSRFHSAPFQRRPVNRSTGPRFHFAPLHRLKSSKTGCPGAVSAKVSPSPISRQAAHQGLAKTFALTTPPTSVRPLPLRASRWPYACPPPARRRPASHPAGTSRQNAAPRPVDGHNIDKLRVRRGIGSAIRSLRTTPVCCHSPPHFRGPRQATPKTGPRRQA